MSDINQISIALFGLTAIALTQVPRPEQHRIRRWAPVFGLISQPFWIYETFQAAQPGMLILSICYTVAWGYGLFMQWRP
jgi:hypothetical protein